MSLAFVVVISACTPQSGAPPAGEAAKGPVLQGTVSGGGGNGCEGKAFEAYAKKISTLEEYRLYVAPIFRRLRASGNDLFVDYLEWAAESKAWYFVPCELGKLPQEQVGVSIQYEQLALHGEHGIYIDSRGYNAKDRKMKDKASLLLHEIVMGARLLSKQSPKKQCEILAGSAAAKNCADKDLALGTEASAVTDPKKIMALDAADHEAIRAMTVYLGQKTSDFTGDGLRAARRRMGFELAWDRSLSDLKVEDVVKALSRTILTALPFHASEASSKHYFSGKKARCAFELDQSTSDYGAFTLHYLTDLKLSKVTSEQVALRPEQVAEYGLKEGFSLFCADRLTSIKTSGEQGAALESVCKEHYASWLNPWTHAAFTEGNMEVRGQRIGSEFLDEVTLYPTEWEYKGANSEVNLKVMTLMLTREAQPRVQSIRIEFKRIMVGTGGPRPDGQEPRPDEDRELLDDPSRPALECAVTNP